MENDRNCLSSRPRDKKRPDGHGTTDADARECELSLAESVRTIQFLTARMAFRVLLFQARAGIRMWPEAPVGQDGAIFL
jgi:hypothetical protein